MLASISNFGNNAAGLEKALRLAQALSTIGGSLATTKEDQSPWLLARAQFNLSRRFFRLHKWIDHFSLASQKFNNTEEQNTLVKLLDVTKNGFLGIYFFMEMGTIKFWFYAIATSLLMTFYQLFFTSTSATCPASVIGEKNALTEKTDISTTEKTSAKEKKTPNEARGRNNKDLYRQILIDGCDLFVPGAAVGWIPIETLSVGIFMSISSVLAMGSMWPKIQAQANATAAKKKIK
ncbi:hypothetical protein E2P81_ATG11463 [Venturia nashicola]|uniref:Uncharacterized protein n=1 Tax=Venturia nashicola TaxID=86259 RepID=A0A4Z1PC14_9PEZI|nr:hypothetical protein E6O75_ATG11155 [Venturia nashicola]TLD35344.1 hypothetical protein E2P81_ATG11463 [Venturia nashicola]